MRKPFRDFDLPTTHLSTPYGHYVPARTRDSTEAERRHALPEGSLVLEQQEQGVLVAWRLVEGLAEEEQVGFAYKLMAAAALNSAYYVHAHNAPDVMRRRLKLPPLDLEGFDADPTSLGYLSAAAIGSAAPLAELLRLSHEGKMSTTLRYKKKFGVAIGQAGLMLAAATHANAISGAADEFDRQDIVRSAAQSALVTARLLEAKVGQFPSLAALADPDSNLSVYYRRHAATQQQVEAYEAALASAQAA